jgi:hypothetical protein
VAFRKILTIGFVVLTAFFGLSLGVTDAMPWLPAGKALENQWLPGLFAQRQIEKTRQIIRSYVEGNRADDPLIELPSGAWVKSSNYDGVTIGGEVYYYILLPHQSFDPLSRGAVTPDAVTNVDEISDGESVIIIYTLTHPATNV